MGRCVVKGVRWLVAEKDSLLVWLAKMRILFYFES